MGKRVALVTGASRGIGRAVADTFRSEGVSVITPTRKEMDLSSDSSIDRYIMSLTEPIDILVNNAGVNILSLAEEVTDENIRETLQINLLAALRIIKKVIPLMVHAKHARIVNVSSIWAMVAKPGRLTYSMAKSALCGMTRALAVELAPHGILVNCVAPGYVDTELTKKNNSVADIENIKKTIPLGRLSEPAEIAEVVSFLSSGKNSYITGQTVIADGGFTCL
ncbi:MAG: SDR family oxidoreductase [Candidatus Omnitrophota bacterium]|jgi:3-oxoacyl-[acyl-carrier protein] reductase